MNGACLSSLDHRPSLTFHLEHVQSVYLDGNLLFDRKTEGRFPETKELKQMIRDVVDPSKNLGHSDTPEAQELPEDDAAEQRKFFGVN